MSVRQLFLLLCGKGVPKVGKMSRTDGRRGKRVMRMDASVFDTENTDDVWFFISLKRGKITYPSKISASPYSSYLMNSVKVNPVRDLACDFRLRLVFQV